MLLNCQWLKYHLDAFCVSLVDRNVHVANLIFASQHTLHMVRFSCAAVGHLINFQLTTEPTGVS